MAQPTKTIYTKASEILIGVWNGDTAPTSGVELASVIADSLSITQDDPDTTDIDCETSDDPIYTVATAGSYQVELNNASIDTEFLTTVMGWTTDTTTGAICAPSNYESRYLALQVKFEGGKCVYLPKILVAPKLVFESLSTNVAYGTLSGTATSATVGDTETPIAMLQTPILTKATVEK